MNKRKLFILLAIALLSQGTSNPKAEKILEIPLYRQNDARWANEKAQFCNKTIGSIGCAITATAMVLNYYGYQETPSTLNIKLEEWSCPLEWDALETRFSLHIVRKDSKLDVEPKLFNKNYVHDEMQKMIDLGYPVILGLENTKNHGTHFIVVYGYMYEEGILDFYVLDPSLNTNFTRISQISSDWNYYRMVVYQD